MPALRRQFCTYVLTYLLACLLTAYCFLPTARCLLLTTHYPLLTHYRYASGRMLSGEIKKELIDVITPMVQLHQAARNQVTPIPLPLVITPTNPCPNRARDVPPLRVG